MHQEVLSYIETNRQRFIDELFALLRIPSVSANPAHQGDVLHMADHLKQHFIDLGLDNVQLLETKGFPVVYAEKQVDPGLPTVMVYGHYDVQPPDPLDLWHSPPFEPVLKDNKIYARGACDDKGQMFMHVKAFEILYRLDRLPCNIKFFIEGEEEVGSSSLESALEQYRDLLACDLILISDTSMLGIDTPSISVGLRGLAYLEVEITGPNRDLHSGVYGGAVDNPIGVLCEMIAKLKDENRRITIPGFYDPVIEHSPEERAEMARLPFNESIYLNHLDIAATRGEAGYSIIEQSKIRPCLDVNGIWGGYTGEGAKTVIPSKAYAKISMRLVANQDADEVARQFMDYFPTLAPPTVKVKVTPHHGGNPYLADKSGTPFQAASLAIEQTFGRKPFATYEGGSIPILALFKKILGAPILLMGFGLDSDAIHSPNEHFGVFNFFKGIETIALFYPQYVALQRASVSA
jgi:acetylornithine deacetylase/succinyl-diaminopimelate desuccinylase-like protein